MDSFDKQVDEINTKLCTDKADKLLETAFYEHLK